MLAAFIVPVMLAEPALFLHAYARERAGVERAALDVSRALMQAVDRELISARAALEALATSPSLDHGDLDAFHAQAIAVLHARPGNVLVLTDPGLRQVDNSNVGFGGPCRSTAIRPPCGASSAAPGRPSPTCRRFWHRLFVAGVYQPVAAGPTEGGQAAGV